MSPAFRTGRIEICWPPYGRRHHALVAVAVERFLNASLILGCHRRGSPQISTAFIGQTGCQVARPSVTVLGLARSRQAESLLDSLVGFHLVSHDVSLSTIALIVGLVQTAEDS